MESLDVGCVKIFSPGCCIPGSRFSVICGARGVILPFDSKFLLDNYGSDRESCLYGLPKGILEASLWRSAPIKWRQP